MLLVAVPVGHGHHAGDGFVGVAPVLGEDVRADESFAVFLLGVDYAAAFLRHVGVDLYLAGEIGKLAVVDILDAFHWRRHGVVGIFNIPCSLRTRHCLLDEDVPVGGVDENARMARGKYGYKFFERRRQKWLVDVLHREAYGAAPLAVVAVGILPIPFAVGQGLIYIEHAPSGAAFGSVGEKGVARPAHAVNHIALVGVGTFEAVERVVLPFEFVGERPLERQRALTHGVAFGR